MEGFNHRMITKAKLHKPTGHTGGTVGMQSLIGRREPMAAALFEHKRHLERCAMFLFRGQGEALTGKGALMTDTEGVCLAISLSAQCFSTHSKQNHNKKFSNGMQ